MKSLVYRYYATVYPWKEVFEKYIYCRKAYTITSTLVMLKTTKNVYHRYYISNKNELKRILNNISSVLSIHIGHTIIHPREEYLRVINNVIDLYNYNPPSIILLTNIVFDIDYDNTPIYIYDDECKKIGLYVCKFCKNDNSIKCPICGPAYLTVLCSVLEKYTSNYTIFYSGNKGVHCYIHDNVEVYFEEHRKSIFNIIFPPHIYNHNKRFTEDVLITCDKFLDTPHPTLHKTYKMLLQDNINVQNYIVSARTVWTTFYKDIDLLASCPIKNTLRSPMSFNEKNNTLCVPMGNDINLCIDFILSFSDKNIIDYINNVNGCLSRALSLL